MNELLTKEKFVDMISEKVFEYLPDDEYETEVKDITRTDSSYTGVIVRKKGSNIAPSFNADAFYADYVNGACIDDMLKQMAQTASNPPSKVNSAMDILKNYSTVKEKLTIKAFDTSKLTDGIISREMIDGVSIVPYIVIDKSFTGMMASAVREELLDLWDVDAETVIADAIENAPTMMPMTCKSMLAAMGIPDEEIPIGMPPFYIVSNDAGCGGAAAIFYDGALEKIKDKIGGDFLIIPSSVDEMLVAPINAIPLEAAKEMQESVNAETVKESEQLPNRIYVYENGELRVGA